MKSTIHEHKKQIKMNVSKKAITVFTICLLFIAGTQISYAQTKEETIAWIKEKLEKYGNWNISDTYKITDVKVSPCRISWTYMKNGEAKIYCSFNPSSVKSWKVAESKEKIMADSKAILWNWELSRSSRSRMSENLYIANGEANIHERMIKALLHLATFCEQGKGEAF